MRARALREPTYDLAAIRLRASDNERPIKVFGAKVAVLFNAKRNGLGNLVKSQIIFRSVNFLEQFSFQRVEPHWIEFAFKNRLLNALPKPFTCLGDPSQTSTTGVCLG
uniref:Uncharacterized protein n=1 Tax=mine drainage metagenome TaxID=410659 RepID=E6PG24_9ZZZZ